MSDELKPCPFCGNVAAIWRDEKHGIYTVFCTDCNAEIKVCFSREAAVDAWNNRVLPPFTPATMADSDRLRQQQPQGQIPQWWR